MHLTMRGKSASHKSGSMPVVPSMILWTAQKPKHFDDTFSDWQQSVKSCTYVLLSSPSVVAFVVVVVFVVAFSAFTTKKNIWIFLQRNWIRCEIITFEWVKAFEWRLTIHFAHIQIGVRWTSRFNRQYPNIAARRRFSPQRCNVNRNRNEFSRQFVMSSQYLRSSCSTVMRRSCVTRFVPAAKISLFPRRHMTVSFSNNPIITHVNNASLPSVTTDGPPVPNAFELIRLTSHPNEIK